MQTNRLEELENTINSIIAQNLEFLREYSKIRPGGIKKALFTFSMTRLKASFEAAMLLMRNGYFMELSSIFRLIFEQLSWGCYLFTTDEIQTTEEDLTKLKSPQQTIGYLKTAMQQDSLGPVYGLLSSGAHLTVSEITRYLDKNTDDCKIDIIFQTEEADKDDISILYLLAGIYLDVTYTGIKHFGFSDKTCEDDFLKQYRKWHKGSILQLTDLMQTNEPLLNGN